MIAVPEVADKKAYQTQGGGIETSSHRWHGTNQMQRAA